MSEPVEWITQGEAGRRLKLARSTIAGRIAAGRFVTRPKPDGLAGVLVRWPPEEPDQGALDERADAAAAAPPPATILESDDATAEPGQGAAPRAHGGEPPADPGQPNDNVGQRGGERLRRAGLAGLVVWLAAAFLRR